MTKTRSRATSPASSMSVVPPGTPSAMGWCHRERALAMAGRGTQCIHAGSAPDPAYGAVTPPVYQTTTFAYLDVATSAGFEYTRTSNPTRACLEEAIALLEGGGSAVCTSSGMSAALVALNLLDHGSHVMCPMDCYGGTYRTLEHAKRAYGLEVTYLDMTDLEAVEKALKPTTRMIWAETPSNPLLRLSDLSALSRISKAIGALLVVDNSFLSPILQRPFVWGADLVMHSTSKYLNGHSDVIGGAVVAAPGRPDLGERLAILNKTLGTSQSPHDCFLVLRGIKTLPLRMQAHEANARAVADFLAKHPAVGRVNYPGLPVHPQHELAKRQQLGFGAVLSIELRRPTKTSVDRFLRALKWFTLAESLGGVESLVNRPASMSHASMSPEIREQVGIREGLIRLSVGIENQEDLVEDLGQALQAAKGHR
jgi:cystathionine gamma-synthase